MTATYAAKAATIAILAAIVLTGCGRKAPLDTPPGRVVVPGDDGSGEKREEEDRRFILDPLIL